MPNVHIMSLTAAIDVLFSVNFAVAFDFMYFRFRPSKAKWIGNVLPNRRNAVIRSMLFFSFITRFAYWRTESSCVIRRCAANRKKICEIKFGNYRRCKFGPHYLLAQEASKRQYIGAAQVYPSLILQQTSWTLFSAFCLFVRTLPIDFALEGQKRNYIKLKTTAKLIREKYRSPRTETNWDRLTHSWPPYFLVADYL